MANFIFKAKKEGKTYVKDEEALHELTDIFTNKIQSRLRNGKTTDMKPLAKSTVQNYVHKINRVATLVEGMGYTGKPEFLLRFDDVKDKLLNSGLDSLKDYVTPIVKLMRYYDMDVSIISKYQKLLSELKIEETKKRGENLATKKQEMNNLPLDEINKCIDDYTPNDETELVYKMLCMMYFQNDNYTPRLEDIPLMKLVNVKKRMGDMNKDYNYITTNGNNGRLQVREIVLNNYKTKNTYGMVRFPIPQNVAHIMNRYLLEYGKQNGDYFILNSKNEPYLIQTFSHLLENSTEAIIGKKMTVNLIRRIKISAYYNSGAKTINEEEAEAKKYLHSSALHRQYLSVNLIDREEE